VRGNRWGREKNPSPERGSGNGVMLQDYCVMNTFFRQGVGDVACGETKARALACGVLCLNLAEAVGFEPTEPCGSTVFKTAAIDHSATPPTPLFSIALQGCPDWGIGLRPKMTPPWSFFERRKRRVESPTTPVLSKNTPFWRRRYFLLKNLGGSGGIRTPEGLLPTGFRDQHIKPL
jgi:hypothetical protein